MKNPFLAGRGTAADELTSLMNEETIRELPPEDREALAAMAKAQALLDRELPPGYAFLVGVGRIEEGPQGVRLARTLHLSSSVVAAVPFFLEQLYKSALNQVERWRSIMKPQGDA